MSRPSRIKTTKDAYDDGFSVGSDRSGMSAGGWPYQSDFDKRDAFVDAWLRGFSDGQKTPRGMPLWATNPPKRKTMKRRKYKRTARRGGRVMTVTTSSRVVKTTRMNPRRRYRSDRELLGDFVRDFVRMSGGRKPTEKERRWALTLMGLGGSPNITAQQILRERSNPSRSAKITDAYRKTFFQHYLVAALWSSNDNSDESGGEPLDKNYGIEDIAPDSLKKLRLDCDRFINKYAPVLAALDADGRETAEQAGHDFWLTRNGHGAGFWDRGLGKIGDVLSKGVGWRTPFGEIDLYVGDDGKLHISGLERTKSNPRPSKTHIEFVIQGNYGYGWDDENTELTREDAKRSLREYRENGPGSYRLIRRRVKNDATNPHDARTAETVRIPSVIRATLPASSGDPRRAETRRLRVVRVAAARSNPSQGGGYWVLRKETGSGPRYLAGRSNEMTRDAAKAMKFLSKMGAQSYCRDFGHSREGYRTVQLPATNPGPTAKEAALLKTVQDDYVRAQRAYDERRHNADARVLRKTAVKARIRLRGWWRAINHKYKLGLFKNPQLALKLSRATWRRLPKGDRRARGSVRFVRCKTSKRGAAHWLRCVVR